MENNRVSGVRCAVCGKSAVLTDPLTREPLCFQCFEGRLLKRVRKTLVRYPLTPFSRIILAISGGKDSSVMAMLTTKVEREFPGVELIGVTVDEGIRGYREEGIKLARKLAKRLGIEHKIYSMKEVIGYTVPEAYELNPSFGACSYCGVFRRRVLDHAARELNADFIAVGHNLSDIVQTFIMNIMRGEKNKLFGNEVEWPLAPRIWPIRKLTERMVTLYAFFSGIEFQEIECPYAHLTFRDPIRRFVLEMEAKYPESLYAALSIRDSLHEIVSPRKEKLNRCEICGFPTSRKICRVCELKIMLNKFKENKENL